MLPHPLGRAICAGLLAATVAAACAPAPAPPTPVVVQLSWTHSAQFAGLYAAEQQGYFAAEGLAVTLRGVPPTGNAMQEVLNGAATFALVNSPAVLAARAAGAPVRVVAVIYRRSPTVYIALAESGITRPQHLAGKIIQTAVPSGLPLLHAVTSRVGLKPDDYTVVPTAPDLGPLLEGRVNVRSVWLTDEVPRLRAAGHRINIIYPDDYGVHFYGESLVAADATIHDRPEVVTRFLRAALKGWTYAVENPTPAGQLSLLYRPSLDADAQVSQMVASVPLVNTGEDHVGWIRPGTWSEMARVLREQGAITAPLDPESAYTLRFLEQVYAGRAPGGR